MLKSYGYQKRDARKKPHSGSQVLTIGDLSRLTGVSIKAIRYYESIGLLPPSSRGSNGYRYYTLTDVNRVNLLRRLRLLGASLTEAKPLLDATTTAQCSEIQSELLRLMRDRLTALDQEIEELMNLRRQVEACQQRLATCPLQKDEPFATCFDGSCLACSRLSQEAEQECRTTRREQGFYDRWVTEIGTMS
jgi:MerR family copper efflux transcriptional regulator